jgi:hypothetical protein
MSRPGNVWQYQEVDPETTMYEIMRVKSKLQQRSQNIGDASSMECLLRKAIGNEWSQPKKEVCGL